MSDTSLFGTRHLVLIALSFAMIVGLLFVTKKWTVKKCAKAMLIVGIISEIVKIFFYINANEDTHGGVLPKTDLPFHLCSIQILLVLIVNITANEKLRRMVLSFMMPSGFFGGIAAILIATGSARSTVVIGLQYFLYHIALTVFALKLMTDKDMKWRAADLLSCLKFLLIMMFCAFYINSIVYDGVSNINFMYVVGPPQEGLPFLNKDHGWLVYIAHYASLIVICVSACYVKAVITTIREKKVLAQGEGVHGTATGEDGLSVQEEVAFTE